MGAGNLLRTIAKLCALIIGIVTLVVLVRTLALFKESATQPECTPFDSDFIKADASVIKRFQKALQFKTISRTADDYNTAELINIQRYIKETYAVIHSSSLVTFEVVANYSLLYHVKGSDDSLTPYLLMGHLDVVPADDGDEWDAPPFSGQIVDDYIYGRGTIDNKQTVFGILEAVEFALSRGFKPRRSFYMAFGHDEEVQGRDGAYNIAALLADRGLQFEFILDEGMTVLEDIIKGIDVAVGLIGCSEKGWLTLRLSVNVSGGHSSMPEKESSIGILSDAVKRLENNPHPSQLGTGPETALFEQMASEMVFGLRVVMSNIWLFKPLLSYIFSQQPSTNAIIRTTTAVTEFHAGIKENVIAPWAWATVNHRVHPSQTIQQVIDYDVSVINDDRVNVTVMSSMAPHPISPYADDTFGYQMLKTSIRQIWGHKDVLVAPGLMVGNTDTRYYLKLSKQIYRFSPTFMRGQEDLRRFHGRNERISLGNYEQAVNFFYHVLVNADAAALPERHTHNGEL